MRDIATIYIYVECLNLYTYWNCDDPSVTYTHRRKNLFHTLFQQMINPDKHLVDKIVEKNMIYSITVIERREIGKKTHTPLRDHLIQYGCSMALEYRKYHQEQLIVHRHWHGSELLPSLLQPVLDHLLPLK